MAAAERISTDPSAANTYSDDEKAVAAAKAIEKRAHRHSRWRRARRESGDLPPDGGPSPESEGETAAAPRLSAADHARQVLSSSPNPRAAAITHHGRQPMGGRLPRDPTGRPPHRRWRAARGAEQRILPPGPAGGRAKGGEAGTGSEWPAAPRTRGPWGRSPTRSRYSRDHERKGGARGAARPPASPAHVRTGRRDRTIPPYAHTDGAERSTRPTGATATHAAAAVPPLRLKLFQPYIIKIIPPSSYVYPFVIHMRHLVPAAAPRWSLDLFSSAQCPTAWWWRPLVFFLLFF